MIEEQPIEEQQIEEKPLKRDDGYSDLDNIQPSQDYFSITKQTELDNKIISSFAKAGKLVKLIPRVSTIKLGIPYLDKRTGKPKMFHGVLVDPETGEKVIVKAPLLRKIRHVRILDGFDKKEIDFPIKDWFNDSITSTILTSREAAFIRRVDDLAISLFIKQMNNPKFDYTGFLHRLYFIKSSIADTGKSINGRGIEAAKTNIHRSESTAWQYSGREEQQKYEDFKKRKDSNLLDSFMGKGKITMM